MHTGQFHHPAPPGHVEAVAVVMARLRTWEPRSWYPSTHTLMDGGPSSSSDLRRGKGQTASNPRSRAPGPVPWIPFLRKETKFSTNDIL